MKTIIQQCRCSRHDVVTAASPRAAKIGGGLSAAGFPFTTSEPRAVPPVQKIKGRASIIVAGKDDNDEETRRGRRRSTARTETPHTRPSIDGWKRREEEERGSSRMEDEPPSVVANSSRRSIIVRSRNGSSFQAMEILTNIHQQHILRGWFFIQNSTHPTDGNWSIVGLLNLKVTRSNIDRRIVTIYIQK